MSQSRPALPECMATWAQRGLFLEVQRLAAEKRSWKRLTARVWCFAGRIVGAAFVVSACYWALGFVLWLLGGILSFSDAQQKVTEGLFAIFLGVALSVGIPILLYKLRRDWRIAGSDSELQGAQTRWKGVVARVRRECSVEMRIGQIGRTVTLNRYGALGEVAFVRVGNDEGVYFLGIISCVGPVWIWGLFVLVGGLSVLSGGGDSGWAWVIFFAGAVIVWMLEGKYLEKPSVIHAAQLPISESEFQWHLGRLREFALRRLWDLKALPHDKLAVALRDHIHYCGGAADVVLLDGLPVVETPEETIGLVTSAGQLGNDLARFLQAAGVPPGGRDEWLGAILCLRDLTETELEVASRANILILGPSSVLGLLACGPGEWGGSRSLQFRESGLSSLDFPKGNWGGEIRISQAGE